MAAKKLITVFGATGNQGGSVVQVFLNDPKLKNDWAVRAVTRDASKDSPKKLASEGAEVVTANLDDKESLVKAMTGASAVFGVTNYWEKLDVELETQQGKNLADAAKDAGVDHFIWSCVKDPKKLTNGKLDKLYHFDSKAAVMEYTRELGIPATFFMAGFFMSNLPGSMFTKSPTDGAWTLNLPCPGDEAQIPMFDTADTGKFVKAIVLNRDKLLGKEVYGATAYMTPNQVVETFKKTFPEAGKTAKFVSLSHEEYLQSLKSTGAPDYVAEEMLQNMRLLSEGGYYGFESLDESHAILEKEDKLTTWEEFLKKPEYFAGVN
ncbi:NmrA-like family protein [Pleurostoma richardsiae]|uniref:NmrA-like family protein n=1 Tax=Pleurostoma richardsiae TaxID=41990 RepID=A0AA38VB46_9PEZI|nr:NmrA-like family protein [Pleurostoma richardsiae]